MNSLDESFFLGKVGGKGWEFELEGVVRDENSNPGKDDGSKGRAGRWIPNKYPCLSNKRQEHPRVWFVRIFL